MARFQTLFFLIDLEKSAKDVHDATKATNNITGKNKSLGLYRNKAATFEEKQQQLMLADCLRLKKRMSTAKSSINRPPL